MRGPTEMSKMPRCKKCGCRVVYRNGKTETANRQRYLCSKCGHTWTPGGRRYSRRGKGS